MKKLFIYTILLLCSICSCNKSTVPNENVYVQKYDAKAFELIIASFLKQEVYTQENLFVSTSPVFEDTLITKDEWDNWLQNTKIKEHRKSVLDRKNLQSIKIEDYKSCNFPIMVPPTVEQDQDLPKLCNQFLNKYALTTTLPKQPINKENEVSVVVGLFSNAGYTYYRFVFIKGKELKMISKEKISGVYS